MTWLDLYAEHLRLRCAGYAAGLREKKRQAMHTGRPIDGYTPAQLTRQAARVLATAPKAPR